MLGINYNPMCVINLSRNKLSVVAVVDQVLKML